MDVIMKKFLKLNKRVVMKKTMFFMILALALSVKATAGNEWQVNRIVHDGKNVYVGTENVGLIAIDKQSGGQTQYLHKWSDYAKGICDVSVHNGNVYYVTKYYKLVTLKDGEMTEEPINVPYAAPDRFLFPRLAWASDGTMWTYHINNLVMHMGRMTFLGKEETEPEYGGLFACEEVISNIAVDPEGVVWFCCKGQCSDYGFCRFSKETGMSLPLRKASNPNPFGRYFSSMAFDSDGNRWFASNSGMVLFDKSEELTLYELQGLKSDICQLADSRYLISNDKALYAFGDGVFSLICENASQKTIRCLDADGDTYYFGSEDGLFKYEAGQVMQIPLPGQTLAVEKPVAKEESAVTSASYTLDGKRLSGERPAGEKGVIVQEGRKTVVRKSSR